MDDLLLMLSFAELKSPERVEIQDGWEHCSYLGGSVLRGRGAAFGMAPE